MTWEVGDQQGSVDDPQVIILVTDALRSQDWLLNFKFFHWLARWIGRIQAWGGGCKCHELELLDGQDVQCPMKGRRLVECHGYALQELRTHLQEASQWTAASFGNDANKLRTFQGIARAVYAHGVQKIDCFQRLPWSLCRIDLPGQRDLLLEEFGRHPPQDHALLSRIFLDPTYPNNLRFDVDAMLPDGSGMTDRLALEA